MSSLDYALTLLSLAGDPAKSKARLAELSDAEKRVNAAIARHDESRRRSEQAAKALGDLQHEATNLEQREAALDKRAEQLAVASSAHAERDKAQDRREQELNAKQAEHAKAVLAHDQKVAQARALLG
jgi:hypothetical protein